MGINNIIKREEGTTLIESLVALVLLLSVLLPTAIFIGYFTSRPINKKKIMALGVAQTEMESVLMNKKYENSDKIDANGWVIKDSVEWVHENLINIRVSVFKYNDNHPVVTLETARLYDKNTSSQ